MSNKATPPVTNRETIYRHLTVRQIRVRDDLEQVNPIGEVDLCTAAVLRDALADTERRQVPNVLVDLSEVRFLALVGVQVLRAAGDRSAAEHRRLVLAAPTQPVQRVLSLTDVTGELEVYVTLPSARFALG
ncbi:STAS domain-containing protein [Actinophytocola sp. NPDC049390]|uniref:STAS domain-containing protein n=1 Tax=Actinophytocola sp. NPDC049390 TaxID=3363894 RepID=UPI00379040CC